MIPSKVLQFVLLLFFLFPLGLSAQISAVHTVTSTADSGPGSLREAFSLSAPDDTIRFDVRGIIGLTSSRLTFNNNINIEGPGPDSLIISGDSSMFVFFMPSGTADVNVSGLTIQGGLGYGFYIFNNHSVTMENMVFRENYGPNNSSASGAYLWASKVSLKNCSFIKNRTFKHSSSIAGGGAFISADSVWVDSCEFSENHCSGSGSSGNYLTRGGGLSVGAPYVRISNSNFKDNIASNLGTRGGGLSISGNSSSSSNNKVFLENCVFDGNRIGGGTQYGAGIYLTRADSVVISDCTFNNNYHTGFNPNSSGGAIWAEVRKSMIISNTQLDSNRSEEGAAVYCRGYSNGVGELIMNHCTLDQNDGDIATVFGLRLENATINRSRFTNTAGIGIQFRDNVAKASILGCEFSNSSNPSIWLDSGVSSGENLIENCTFNAINTWALRFEDTPQSTLVKHCAFVNVINPAIIDNAQVTYTNNIFSYITQPTFSSTFTFFNGGSLTSGGGNVSRSNDFTSFLTAPSDLHSTNPVLINFGFNGGPTQTYELNFNSPAINHGGMDTLTTDQRGFIRDSLVDAGPYEFNGVNPSLVTVISQSSAAILCEGDSLTLQVNAVGEGSLNYQWQLNGSSISGANLPQFSLGTVSSVDAGNYTCIVSNASSTDTSEVIAVTVNALPTANAGNNQAICLGQSANLNASGGTTYSWNQGLGSGAAQTVNPTTTTTYAVTVTDANNCSANDDITVTVNAIPNANAGSNQTICAGQSVNLSASGGTTYTWNQGLGNGAAQTVNPTTTTTYSVTVTDANNCSTNDDVTVTVNSLPVANAGSNQTICAGQTVNLNASGGTTYTWNQGLGSGAAQTVNPTTTTTYAVTVTDANNCSANDDVTVTVNSLPVANAGSNQTICAGQTVSLNASGGTTYSWNQGLGSGAAQTVNPTTTTTYSVTVTDANNCSANDDITVTVNAIPNANAGGNQAICLGQSANLSASGGTTYTWNQGLGNGATQTVSPTTTTTYSVTVTNANNCSANDDITITVNALPTANAGNDQTICEGQNVILNAAGGNTYTWNQGLGAGASHTVSPTTSTTYSVTVTNANNCDATDDITVTVNPLPAANAGGDQTICEGQSASLSASGGSSYSWNQGIGNGANQTVTPTMTTTYTVTVTDGNNCSATDDVIVIVNPLPNVSFSGLDPLYCNTAASVVLTGSPAGGSFSGPGINAATFDPAQAGVGIHDIQYAFTDQNGCSDSIQSTTEVEICIGLEDQLSDEELFTVYPNPFVDEFAIQMHDSGIEAWTVQVIDPMGRTVKVNAIQDGNRWVLDMTQISSGSYILILTQGGRRLTRKLTKLHP